MVMQSQTTKFFSFFIFNVLLFIFLYSVPIENATNLCIFKQITSRECWNCGMTRAFLSILHFDFTNALNYNWKVLFVFPFTIILYLYSWFKYIFRKV